MYWRHAAIVQVLLRGYENDVTWFKRILEYTEAKYYHASQTCIKSVDQKPVLEVKSKYHVQGNNLIIPM